MRMRRDGGAISDKSLITDNCADGSPRVLARTPSIGSSSEDGSSIIASSEDLPSCGQELQPGHRQPLACLGGPPEPQNANHGAWHVR